MTETAQPITLDPANPDDVDLLSRALGVVLPGPDRRPVLAERLVRNLSRMREEAA